jgi:hypothetical protein
MKQLEGSEMKENTGLVGLWFHSIDAEGFIEKQGVITGNPEPGWYLIRPFEWIAGTRGFTQHLVSFNDMHNWLFYEDDEEMRNSCEYGPAQRLMRRYG